MLISSTSEADEDADWLWPDWPCCDLSPIELAAAATAAAWCGFGTCEAAAAAKRCGWFEL